ncbi:MAG TPA: META domain-containing protein [Paracoccaceae bacterium]|nr:META domain-containing protein [Paracoccaceae bacterium]
MQRALALAVMALSLCACAGVEPVAETPESPAVTSVGDTSWRLVAVNGESVESDEIVMKIEGGFISGQGPCNMINANYVGEPPAFQVETLITTRMICDRLGLERRMIDGLSGARQAVIENGRLTISGEGSPVLVFRPV